MVIPLFFGELNTSNIYGGAIARTKDNKFWIKNVLVECSGYFNIRAIQALHIILYFFFVTNSYSFFKRNIRTFYVLVLKYALCFRVK